MERFDCRLLSRRTLSEGVRELAFARCDGQPLRFVPGQYVQVLFAADSYQGCYYSLSAPPQADGTFKLCVKDDDGLGARTLFALELGDTLAFAGPDGQLVLDREPGDAQRDVLLVATGTGIAPFRAMSDQLDARLSAGRRVQLLYGARQPVGLLYDDIWRELAARHEAFSYVATVSGEAQAGQEGVRRGRVTAHLAAALVASEAAQGELLALLCGIPAMVSEVRAALRDAGLDAAQIRTEY
ncbi:MAG: FAD-dependent oxidoreductase [Myxococcales bacterium]|nr:FAD-dependent oxidoreductase [Myxococcales bacterium]